MKSDIRIWLAIVLLAIATAAYFAMNRSDTEPINGVLVRQITKDGSLSDAICIKGGEFYGCDKKSI